MSIFFDKLVTDVHADHSASGCVEVRRADIEDIVRITIKRMGQCVNTNTGEVYDPAPKSVINYPNQNGARTPRMRRRR